MSADFGTDDKYVQLVRSEAQCRLWLKQFGDARDPGSAPSLYVRAYGQTFEAALSDACEKAKALGLLRADDNNE
jgi:hypothetical protein